MEFRDFYELAAKVIEYEELLREESQRSNTSMGTYWQEANSEEIAVADLLSTCSFICPLPVKKSLDLWKKSQTSNIQVQYTFEATKTEEIFDFHLRRNSSHFPRITNSPVKRNSREKYIVNIITPAIMVLILIRVSKNIFQDNINKGILKFLEKKEAMVIDEDPFPPMASTNIAATNLRVVLNVKKDERFYPNARIRKV